MTVNYSIIIRCDLCGNRRDRYSSEIPSKESVEIYKESLARDGWMIPRLPGDKFICRNCQEQANREAECKGLIKGEHE
jgi:hypothetical protein